MSMQSRWVINTTTPPTYQFQGRQPGGDWENYGSPITPDQYMEQMRQLNAPPLSPEAIAMRATAGDRHWKSLAVFLGFGGLLYGLAYAAGNKTPTNLFLMPAIGGGVAALIYRARNPEQSA